MAELKQQQAQILTDSKYFIKNNTITPSVEKSTFLITKIEWNIIILRKSNEAEENR